MIEELNPIGRLNRDLRKAATSLTAQEIRFLVDRYYQMQHQRITAANQLRASSEDKEPHEIMGFLEGQAEALEDQIKMALDYWSRADPVCQWMRAQKGIGPVISAGFRSYLDITKAPTAGRFLSYCGQLPGQKRTKGTKIAWNPDLKRLCWLLGESFVKVSGKEDAYYGQIYKQRKAYENANNIALKYKDQAEHKLATVNLGEDTKALAIYKQGMLPPAQINERSKKYAVKMFLCHLHHVMHVTILGELPPKPFALAFLEHVDYIAPPDFDQVGWPKN